MVLRTFASLAVGVLLIVMSDRSMGPISAEMAMPLLKATEPPDMCLMPHAGYSYAAAQAGAERPAEEVVPADWPGVDVLDSSGPLEWHSRGRGFDSLRLHQSKPSVPSS